MPVSLAELEHPHDGGSSRLAFGFVQDDLRAEISEAEVKFLQRVHLHIPALGTGTAVSRSGNQILPRHVTPQSMQHVGFGDDDDVMRGLIPAEIDHFLCRANLVSQQSHRRRTLGMGHYGGIGIFVLDSLNALAGEFNVDVTIAIPVVHLPSGLLRDPCPEILIGDKKDGTICRCGGYNPDCVATGADHVREGFHSR